MKPKIAVFDFASCEGCELQIANFEEQVIDLVHAVDIVSFREVMKEQSDSYDIAFIEGSIHRLDTVGSQSRGDSRGQEQARIGPQRGDNSYIQGDGWNCLK